MQLVGEYQVEDVGWTAPTDNPMVLNVDRYAKGTPGRAGAGGIFRDSEAKWIGGFAINYGIATATTAELRGLWSGLSKPSVGS